VYVTETIVSPWLLLGELELYEIEAPLVLLNVTVLLLTLHEKVPPEGLTCVVQEPLVVFGGG
jgi:hypothetical protein